MQFGRTPIECICDEISLPSLGRPILQLIPSSADVLAALQDTQVSHKLWNYKASTVLFLEAGLVRWLSRVTCGKVSLRGCKAMELLREE